MKKILGFCLTILIVSNISFAQNTISKVEISLKPYKDVTYGAFFKVLTFSTVDNEVIEDIEGFDFQWGYEYKLKVKKEILSQPMTDMSNVKYSLEKIISKEKVEEGYEFEMHLHKNLRLNSDFENALTLKNDITWLYFKELEIIVFPDKRTEFFEIDEKPAKFMFGADNKVYFVGKQLTLKNLKQFQSRCQIHYLRHLNLNEQ